MCNLSQGVEDKGRQKGRAEGRVDTLTEVTTNMLKAGMSIESIIMATKLTEEQIRAIQKSQ